MTGQVACVFGEMAWSVSRDFFQARVQKDNATTFSFARVIGQGNTLRNLARAIGHHASLKCGNLFDAQAGLDRQ